MYNKIVTFTFLLASLRAVSLPAATYHVAPTGSDGAAGSEAAPFATLEAAVAKAVDGDTILLQDGTYRRTSSGPLLVDKAIAIESVNGRDAVTLLPADGKPAEGVRIVHEGAILRGVTLKGFSTKSYNGSSGLYLSKGKAVACAVLEGEAIGCKAAGVVVRDGGRLSETLIAGCSIPDGGSDRRGAGLCIWDGTAERCEIVSNTAPYGAGVAMESDAAIVRECSIRDNDSASANFREDFFGNLGFGAGVYQLKGLLDRCRVIGNRGNRYAGVYAEKGIVRNTLVRSNLASKGRCGGLYSGGANLQNVTLLDNRAVVRGGISIEVAGGTATNLLVSAEGDFSVEEQVAVSATAKIGSSAFPCEVPGTGNVVIGRMDLDPETGRPFADSPAATGFDYSALFDVDLEGSPRPSSFGMGALRPLGPSESRHSLSADRYAGPLPLTVRFSALLDGMAADECEWTFGDGETARGASVDHLFSKAGDFQVVASFPDGLERTCRIRTAPAVVYVATDGGDVSPYDTPDKAARSIQDAIDTVYSSVDVQGEVRVAPGLYCEPEGNLTGGWHPMVTITKRIRLVGLGETREEVLLDAQGKRQVMEVAHPGAVVEHLSMANGRHNENTWYAVGNLLFLDGVVTNCVIRNGYGNYAGNIAMGDGRLLGCEVKDGFLNVSGGDRPAGGVNIFGGGLVANCSIHDNLGGNGAGVFLAYSAKKAVVGHCEIIGNTDKGNGGGGVAIKAGLLDSCVVSNNLSLRNGGGITVIGSDAIVRNCLVVKNESRGEKYGFGYANSGSGGNVSINAGRIEFSTLYGGLAITAGGQDLYQTGGVVLNSIVSPRPDCLPERSVQKGGGTISHSLVPAEGLGETAICGDPMLVSPGAGDFDLLFGSPCLDRAEALEGVTVDRIGRKRPAGDGPDIGCHEIDFSKAFSVSFTADRTSSTDRLEARFTARIVNATEPVTYTWKFGDGTQETTTVPSVSHLFDRGTFDVTLTARDGEGKVGEIVRTSYISVNARDAYVSTVGTAIWPYDTWEKATPVVQDAIDAVQCDAGNPGTVHVADGTYGPRNEKDPFIAILQRPVRVIATNANHRAIFDSRRHAGRRNALVDHPEALLANVGCANGEFQGAGHGAGIWQESGVCSNVAIYNCKGYEGGLSIRGGLFTDGVISNCPNMTHDGFDRLGGGACLYGGVVQRTLVTNCVNGAGGAVFLKGTGAVVRDSLLLGCANYRGAPVYVEQGLVERCLIQGNRNLQDRNDKPQQAAVYATGPESVIRNCLVITNTAIQKGASRYAFVVEEGAMAINNVVLGNIHAKTSVGQGVLNAGGLVVNTIADSLETTGEGVTKANYIGTEPGFRDAEGGDYRLRSSSPCLNAGVNDYWLTVEHPVDFDGKPRIRLGTVDIGAYEFDGILGTLLLFR